MEHAQQLLADAYAADDEGDRLSLQPNGSSFVYGFTNDTNYEGHPDTSSAYQNNLNHIKWTDNRTQVGHIAANGHIYYGDWTGPHEG